MAEELVHTYIEDIAKHLWEPGKYGHASLMVGAGFSKNAISIFGDDQMPDWSELSRDIYEKLYPRPKSNSENSECDIKNWNENKIIKTSGKNVLKLAEEYKVIFGRSKLDKMIEDNISDNNYKPGKLHEKLLELPWNDVFTTNYDTLLERTIPKINIQNRKNYKIVSNQKNLPGSTRPRIIKLHGSVPDSKPYIITEEDYRTYPKVYAPLVNTVQQAMLETQLCLIGFSGDDPNFTSWLGWLRDNMGENCPKIYLCGIFDGLSRSERTLFENNNIIILDLSGLLKLDCENKYEEAIKQFIHEINSIKDKDKNIQCLPDIKNDEQSVDSYFKLISILQEQRKRYQKYPAIPQKDIDILSRNSKEIFDKVINFNFEKSNYKIIILLYELIWRIDKCCIPLYIYEAKKLEKLLISNQVDNCKSIPKKYIKSFKNSWIGINFALCDMYRQYGMNKEFNALMSKLTSKLSSMNQDFLSKYYIENSKYYLQNFDYDKVLKYINKIPDEADNGVLIKKAFLLSQLGLKTEARILLKKISANIAQKGYTNEYKASLVGYMNLCFRTLKIRWGDVDQSEFSDEIFEQNKYNIRNILNSIKDDLATSIQNAEGKQLGVTKSFNPNMFTKKYGTTPDELEKTYYLSYKYLLYMDNLCLPVYQDHRVAVVDAVKLILNFNNSFRINPTWLWSYIIKTNDENIYENFFTRAYVIYIEREASQKIFPNLLKLLDIYEKNDKVDFSKGSISKQCIIDLLSRFSLVVPANDLSSFIKKLISIISKKNRLGYSFINSIFSRLSFCIDEQVFQLIIENVLSAPYNKFSISMYFNRINKNVISDEIAKKYIDDIISKIKDTDIDIRDDAISRLCLLEKCSEINVKSNDIQRAIWSQKNEYGFPKSNLFSDNFWNKLPYPKDIDFKVLMKNYLLDFKFKYHVKENGNISFGGVLSGVFLYVDYFYNSSLMRYNKESKIEWNLDELNIILKKALDYINKEEIILTRNLDIFGESENTREEFMHLGVLTSIVCLESLIKGTSSDDISNNLEKVNDMLEKNNIMNLPLKIIMNIKNYNEVSQELKDEISYSLISNKSETVMVAFISINMIMILDESDKYDFKFIYDCLKEVLASMPYISTEQNRNIFIYFKDILQRDIFKENDYIQLMNDSLYKSFEVIDRKIKIQCAEDFKDIYLLDSLYDLSLLIKRYIDVLKNNRSQVPVKLNKLVEKLKNSRVPEVRNVWLE